MEISANTPVIVSGGASGLGEAVARTFRAKGAPVAIMDLNPETGEKLAQEIGAIFQQADISDHASVADALQQIRKSQGNERITVNCAGIASAAKTVSRGQAHDPELFARVIGINLIGTFNMASQSAEAMTAQDPANADGERGVIINTASIAAFDGQIGQLAYAASKAGVAGMTLPMARDLAKSGVRTMTIAPGIFETPMVTTMPPELQEALASGIPYPNRLGKPEEFAALACHIVENPMLNGETIRLDGATRLAAK